MPWRWNRVQPKGVMSVSDPGEPDEVTEQLPLPAGRSPRIPLDAGLPDQSAQVLPIHFWTRLDDFFECRVALIEQAGAPMFRTVQ